MTWV